MKYSFLISAIFSILLLSGCPLQSDHPLGEVRNAPMDETLLGSWVDNTSCESEEGMLSIFRFNENEYYIEILDNDKKAHRYRAYLAVIDNTRILNLQEVNDKESKKKFMYIKISLGPNDVMTLWTIEDVLAGEKDISSKNDLLSYIRMHINDSRLYDKAVILKKRTER